MPPQRPPRRGNQPNRGPQNKPGRPPDRKVPGSRPKPATPRPGASASGRPKPASSRPGSSANGRPKPAAARRPAGPSKGRQAQVEGSDRLQKILAHAGIGSRRACEELITQGRITVNGEVIRELGTKVDPFKATVALDGQKIHQEKPVYFAVYKPKGYVSTNNDPSGRPRVLDILPEIPQRVYTVGRLDEMSVGLMLLTNDGELANKLSHPRYGVEKLYRVIVAGVPTREVLKQLTDGIWLAEGKVRAKSVRAVARKGEATILEMVLAEGKNREVRRMLAKLGHKVMMLTRVAVGPITIKGLTAGQFRPLTGKEVDLLRRVAAGEPVPMPWMSDRRPARPLPDRPRRGAGDGPREPGRPADDSRRPMTSGPARGRSNEGEPPRRPGVFRPDQQAQGGPDRGPGGYRQGPGGPPRRPEGPGPGPPRHAEGNSHRRRDEGPSNGPPRPHSGPFAGRRAEGPGNRPPRPGDGPQTGRRPEAGPPRFSDGPRAGRPEAGPPRFHDGPRAGRPPEGPRGRPPRPGDGPRPERRAGPGGRPQSMGNGPGPRPQGGGNGRPYRNDRPVDGPRPGPRPPGAGDRPRSMGNGPRPQGGGNGRPDQNERHGDGPRPGPRPPMPTRRPRPVSGDPLPRKVIGMEGEARPTPPPTPNDDRPAPRMKRLPARRSGPGMKPRRRPGGRPE